MQRTLALPRASSTALRALRIQARPFSLSAAQRNNERGTDDTHSVNKVKGGDTHGQHEQSVKGGIESANQEGGGNATAGHDSAGGKAKAKKEFPESPDPGMGMQDERGGKGG